MREVVGSLYESAYKLRLKSGVFDHFTALYLNRFCSFLIQSGGERFSAALKNQAMKYVEGERSTDISRFRQE